MQHPRHGQCELGNSRFELGAVFGHHLVAALHGADRRGQGAAAGVFEAFSRFEQGLLAHHAQSPDLLFLIFRVRDDPVAADELGGDIAGIGDGDGVGEDVASFRCVGLIFQVLGFDLDPNFVFFAFGHGGFQRIVQGW